MAERLRRAEQGDQLPDRDRRNGVTTLKCATAHGPRFLTGLPLPEIYRPLLSNSQDINPVSATTGGPRPATGFFKRSFALSTCATHCSSLIKSGGMCVLLGTGDAQEVEGFFLDVCRPCGDCEGEVGREGGRDSVFGDGGEVVKQGVEAVDGETIVGSACGLLGEGGGR